MWSFVSFLSLNQRLFIPVGGKTRLFRAAAGTKKCFSYHWRPKSIFSYRLKRSPKISQIFFCTQSKKHFGLKTFREGVAHSKKKASNWGLFFNRPFLPLRPSQWPTKKGPIVTFSLTHIWHSFLRPQSTHKSKSSKRTIDFPHIGDNNVFRTPESSQEVAVGVLPGLVAVFSNVCNVLPWVLVLSTIPIGLNLNTDSAIKCTFTRWELRT